MKLTIYHNPSCSKSRQTLELLRQHGIEPNIVEYLQQPPDPESTLRRARLLGIAVVDMLRRNEDEFAAMTDGIALDDDKALADRLQQHPKALQRPIVVDDQQGRAVIGRPPENVLELIAS